MGSSGCENKIKKVIKMKCKINELSINYEVIGEGKPVVMIHGYYPDHRLMAGCMEPVFRNKAGYKRIYLDLPGMGESDSAEWITDSDKMLQIIIDFINKVLPDENFLLAGQSYGGYLSRGIIYKMQERVDGVALICPLILPDFAKRNVPEHIVIAKNKALLSELSPVDAEDFDSSVVMQSRRIYERYQNEVMCGVNIANSLFLQTLQKNGYAFSFDIDGSMPLFKKPALMLLGRQDSCVGYKDAWNILENYPRATFAILDGAGHNLQIEQQETFTSLMHGWLSMAAIL